MAGETELVELQATLMIVCGETTNYVSMHMAYVTNNHMSKTLRSKWIVMLYIIKNLSQVLIVELWRRKCAVSLAALQKLCGM